MLTHKGTLKIETERLILRQAALEDAQAMYDNWASDPEVTRFLTWPPHANVDVTRKILESWVREYERNDYYQWIITVKEAGCTPIGSLFAAVKNEKTGCFHIGYCISKVWWHKGIMSEALKSVMEFLFREVNAQRIESRHDPHNPHSGAVMRKCGMRYEGTARSDDVNNQGICDADYYGILRREWQTSGHFMDGFHAQDDTQLVQELYRRFDENNRLTKSQAARVEYLTTMHHIESLVPPGSRILDLGAGAGEYSLNLARKGYEVCALELAQSNLEAFRKKLMPGDSVTLEQGNAVDLSRYESGSFDAVLLFGPLYHLHKEEDKLRCIHEAKRVCRKGGYLFFAFISNDPVIMTMQQQHADYLLTGDYNKQTFQLDDFPFVFHTPARCRELLAHAGVHIRTEIASDGLSELLKDLIDRMDEKTYQQYLRYHFYISQKAEWLGVSNHLLYIGEKI